MCEIDKKFKQVIIQQIYKLWNCCFENSTEGKEKKLNGVQTVVLPSEIKYHAENLITVKFNIQEERKEGLTPSPRAVSAQLKMRVSIDVECEQKAKIG